MLLKKAVVTILSFHLDNDILMICSIGIQWNSNSLHKLRFKKHSDCEVKSEISEPSLEAPWCMTLLKLGNFYIGRA